MGYTDRFLHRIADDIDRDGIAVVEADVASVVDRARAAGVTGVVVDVLADRSEPAIARARAFGMVATDLLRHERAARPAAPAVPVAV